LADIRIVEAAPHQTSRGLALIVEHCARLNGVEHARPTAVLRLNQAVGDELARLLLRALAGDHRVRPSAV
jgi:hypothetical protein